MYMIGRAQQCYRNFTNNSITQKKGELFQMLLAQALLRVRRDR